MICPHAFRLSGLFAIFFIVSSPAWAEEVAIQKPPTSIERPPIVAKHDKPFLQTLLEALPVEPLILKNKGDEERKGLVIGLQLRLRL